MESCLVLSSAYMPIGVQSIKKAIKKVYQQKAEVIETYTDQHLRSWKQAMEAPAIIRLLHFAYPPRKPLRTLPFTRKNVWLRDKGRCQYCGKFVKMKDMSWDHVVPRDQGGRSTWTNICCCCVDCNRKKDCRTPEQAGMRMLNRPKAPTYTMSIEQETVFKLRNLKQFPHSKWREYIYFSVPLDED